jgi:O-antigen ligase
MIIRREFSLVQSRTVWPLLALVAVAVLAFGQGQLPWFVFAHQAPLDTQIAAVMIFALAAGAFLLVAQQVQDLRWLQWLTWLFVALGGLFVAGWVVPGLGGFTGRLFQLGATSNSLFWTWLVALAFGQAYLNHKLPWGWRLAAAGVAALTIYVGFFLNREWKSGYLPPLAALAVIIGLRSWKVALLMALVAPIGVFYLTADAVATDEYSYSTRIDAWLIIFEMVKRNPLLGFGPANYYWYTPLFPIRGWAVVFNSHNQFVDLVAQTGLLGLGCFFWFFGELSWLGWRLRQRAAEGFAQAYVYSVLGGAAGTLVAAALCLQHRPQWVSGGHPGLAVYGRAGQHRANGSTPDNRPIPWIILLFGSAF